MEIDLVIYRTLGEVRKEIKKCEGKHKQQATYSTHHDALTQICFDCHAVRTNMFSHQLEDK